MARECSTGKVRYRDKLGARIALARTWGRARDESRIYRCEFCHGWHLTSQPKRVTDG